MVAREEFLRGNVQGAMSGFRLYHTPAPNLSSPLLTGGVPDVRVDAVVLSLLKKSLKFQKKNEKLTLAARR